VYVDDGISGAEFANRPGFLRLMNSLKPRPAFQVLVMSEESRLGREAIETAYALRQLLQAGVRVFFYLEDRERTLDSPTDKIMLSLTAFADELEREKARQRTYDAMVRKAKAGHVTGGGCFGYRSLEIVGADGKRSHVEREIEPVQADTIRQIFRLSAGGYGVKAIAKLLNDEERPRQARNAAAHNRGHHRQSARCSFGPSTAVKLSGRRRGHARNGGASSKQADPKGSGSVCRPRIFGLLVRPNGKPRTHG
jgi:DNA invertase Pin-like site-specific DNA recombinase